MDGKRIKIRLLEIGKTQRWLCRQLNQNGFKSLVESTLSSILTGDYTGPLAENVLKESEEILKALDVQR